MFFQCINIRQVPWEVLKTKADIEKPCLIPVLKYYPSSIWHRQLQGQDQQTLYILKSFYIKLLQEQLLLSDNTIMELSTMTSSWRSLLGILWEGCVNYSWLSLSRTRLSCITA